MLGDILKAIEHDIERFRSGEVGQLGEVKVDSADCSVRRAAVEGVAVIRPIAVSGIQDSRRAPYQQRSRICRSKISRNTTRGVSLVFFQIEIL